MHLMGSWLDARMQKATVRSSLCLQCLMHPLCVYSAECFLCLMSFPHPASAVWVWVLVVGVVGVGVVVDALGVVGDAQETN